LFNFLHLNFQFIHFNYHVMFNYYYSFNNNILKDQLLQSIQPKVKVIVSLNGLRIIMIKKILL
jgi:hypothetical protein